MKKFLSILLALAILLTLCCPVFAASLPKMTFDLSCDGAEAHTRPGGVTENALEFVKTGDEITVYYTISAASETKAGVTQNEIYYDRNFFELVDGSVSKEPAFGGYYASAQSKVGGHKYVFFDTIDTYSYGEAKTIGSFTLRVIASAGESVIRNTNYAAAQNYDRYPVTANDLWVGFGEWNGATFQVTLDVSGGTLPAGAVAAKSVNTEKGETVTLPLPTKAFCTFDYWTDGSRQYQAGTRFSPDGHTMLTAHWTQVPAPEAPAGLGTVKASRPGAADGKITGVTSAMEYSTSLQTRFTACTGTAIGGLKAGTYYVRYKENSEDNQPASQAASVQVEAWPLRAAPTGLSAMKTSLPDAKDGKISGVTTSMEYSLTPDDPASFVTCPAGAMTGLPAGIYFIRYSFDAATNMAASETVQVAVNAGNAPDRPSGLVGVPTSCPGEDDGKITGVNARMEYSVKPTFLNPITCPNGAIEGLKAGMYYIRLKADPSTNTPAGNYTAIEIEDGKAPEEDEADSPTAGGNSVDVTVSVSIDENAVATVKSVSDAEIRDAAASESGVVGIDLSMEEDTVESAKLPSGTIGRIANAVRENGGAGFALKLTSASLEFDAKSLQSLANQAGESELQINMRDTGTMALNEAQYKAVKNMTVFGGYQVSAEAGNKIISQFNGGSIRISIPFNIPMGRYAEGFSVYYVSPEGKLTRLASTYQGGMINFTVNHFSDYIIAYSEQNSFVDVMPGAFYEDAVLWAVNNGVTTGTSATTFSPNAVCTRAQIVTFLWRAAGQPSTNAAMSFRDVSAKAYYAEAVRWAVSAGITKGTSAATFSPDAVCTRAEVVTFLWRMMNKPKVSSTIRFSDVGSAYYTDAVCWAVSNGITKGTSKTMFSPSASCTRGEVVTFLWRCLG